MKKKHLFFALCFIGVILAEGIAPMPNNPPDGFFAGHTGTLRQTLQAATQAPYQQLMEALYDLKDDERVTEDFLCFKTSKETSTGYYYQTVEGYLESAKLLEAFKSYLGVDSLNPIYVTIAQSDGGSATCEATLLKNMCQISKKLTDSRSRQQLAQLGENNTDWIKSSWKEAPELVVLHVYGIVNDDFGLIHYNSDNRNKVCSREDFYTMKFRMGRFNYEDGTLERAFQNEPDAAKLYQNIFGKNYAKRNPVAAIVSDFDNMYTSRFFYDKITKANMKEGITRGEVYSLIGHTCRMQKQPSEKTMRKQLISKFRDITTKNFVDEYYGDIQTKKIGNCELGSLWSAWKAGYLKPDSNGKLNLQKKMTYREVVKAMCDGCVKAGKKKGMYGKWQPISHFY